MKALRWKQADAAESFGVKQPDISKMLPGFQVVSVERLARGQLVEIVVPPHPATRKPAQLRIGGAAVRPGAT